VGVGHPGQRVALSRVSVALARAARSFAAFFSGPQMPPTVVYTLSLHDALPILVKPFPVTVTNGQITVQLSIVNYGAIISGIEILDSTGGRVTFGDGQQAPAALCATKAKQTTGTVTGTATTTATWAYSAPAARLG